jgi:hypothetical protein
MEATNLPAEFIAFCVQRRSANWPEIYDEICWVAGRRLFRGLGYVELSQAGLPLGLPYIGRLRRLVEQVAAAGNAC